MNPNGQGQRWSEWDLRVYEVGRHVPRADVEYNAAKWLRAGFGSAGRVKVESRAWGWVVRCVIEGPPAHDPGYVASVRRQWRGFIEQGWGPMSYGLAEVRLLAGSREDGKPSAQLIEMPRIGAV